MLEAFVAGLSQKDIAIAVVAVAVVIGGFLGWAAWRAHQTRPLMLGHQVVPPLKFPEPADVYWEGGPNGIQAIGALGEILTGAIFTASGWHPIPTQKNGTAGIDGMFLKPRDNGRGYDVLITETKTRLQKSNVPKESPEQIGEDGIICRIEKQIQEKYGSVDLLEAIKEAVIRGSVSIRRRFVIHYLVEGMTEVYSVDRLGRNKHCVLRLTGRSHKALILGLLMGIARFSRRGAKIITSYSPDSEAALTC